jgi:hypothetical protein
VTALLTRDGYALEMIVLCVALALALYLLIDINSDPPKK